MKRWRKRFIIKGFHPESDSEWIELEFDDKKDGEKALDNLPEIDHGLGHWELIDTETNEIISYG